MKVAVVVERKGPVTEQDMAAERTSEQASGTIRALNALVGEDGIADDLDQLEGLLKDPEAMLANPEVLDALLDAADIVGEEIEGAGNTKGTVELRDADGLTSLDHLKKAGEALDALEKNLNAREGAGESK